MDAVCEWVKKYAPLAARILLAQLFIISGIGKLGHFAATAAYMASVGLPGAKALLVLTIALEIGGGVLLIVGWQARWVAAAFCAFTLLASFIFHPFWNTEPAGVTTQLNNFMKNLAVIGGMLYVMAYGAGPLSLDRHLNAAGDAARETAKGRTTKNKHS